MELLAAEEHPQVSQTATETCFLAMHHSSCDQYRQHTANRRCLNVVRPLLAICKVVLRLVFRLQTPVLLEGPPSSFAYQLIPSPVEFKW
jgi:hypothetical protein